MIRLLLGVLLLLSAPAIAQEPVIYAPEHCAFSAAFPEEPQITQRCDAHQKNCYEQAAYNYYSDSKNRLHVRVICNAVNADTVAHYTQDVMKTTVQAMARRKSVPMFETSFRQEETYKQMGLVGEDNTASLPRIFIAQLWIGEASSLSVEAELVGEDNAETDSLFSAILKSIGVKQPEATPPDSVNAQP